MINSLKNDTQKFLIKYFITTIVLLTFVVLFNIFSENKNSVITALPTPFMDVEPTWADTLLNNMSTEEKISQIIFYNIKNIDSINTDSVIEILQITKPGGIIFQTDSIKDFIFYGNKFQAFAEIPMLSGLMSKNAFPNFKDNTKYPKYQAINAIMDTNLRMLYYKRTAEVCKEIGININFINGNVKAGTDSVFYKDYILNKTSFIKNIQNANILACLYETNFFGYDSIFYNFNKKIISSGVSCILKNDTMRMDTGIYSFRKKLRNNLNFKGLLISNISDIKDNFQDSVLKLLNSGSEMFITDKPKKTAQIIKYLIVSKKINESKIDSITRRILLAKTWTGLNNFKPVNQDSAILKIKSKTSNLLSLKLFRNSLTLIKNTNNIIPFCNISNKKFNIVIIGDKNLPVFVKEINSYYNIESKHINPKTDNLKELLSKKQNKEIIIALNNFCPDKSFINLINNLTATNNIIIVNFGELKHIKQIENANVLLQVYGNTEIEQKYSGELLFGGIEAGGKLPVNLNNSYNYSTGIKTKSTRLSSALPEEVGVNSELLAKIDSIANDAISRGTFPGCQVFMAKDGKIIFDKAFGFHTYSKQRAVKKTDLYDLASITKIAATTLASMKMFETGKLKLNDSLGKFFKDISIDYSNIKADTTINIDTLLISNIKNINKLLKHQDTLHINDSVLVAYDTLIIRLTPRNNIFKVKIKDILLHKSGISPSLPILPFLFYRKYYRKMIKEQEKITDTLIVLNDSNKQVPKTILDIRKNPFDEYFTREYIKDSAETRIAENFYLQNRYLDSLWKNTKRLRVYSRKIYQYSDINMILLQQAIDSLNNKNIDEYLSENFYKPMGLSLICYKPRRYFELSKIVPTENNKWRRQLLTGDVHDPSAALLGGVSGNAGLFSNARDLGTIGQMWLNGGQYGGMRFLSPKTVNLFSGTHEDSHRGLGFNKPGEGSIIGNGATHDSYGHTGFTGTCIWIDPVKNIVYVFLSNRVHPTQKNWKINSLKIRQKIHSALYDAIEKK